MAALSAAVPDIPRFVVVASVVGPRLRTVAGTGPLVGDGAFTAPGPNAQLGLPVAECICKAARDSDGSNKHRPFTGQKKTHAL